MFTGQDSYIMDWADKMYISLIKRVIIVTVLFSQIRQSKISSEQCPMTVKTMDYFFSTSVQ